MKRPAFQFYPGDWLRDTALRSCSIAARGLWIDLMCYMHDGTPYGHLSVAGEALKSRQIAHLVGLPYKRFLVLFRELDRAKIFSRTAAGIVYSRRMIRDEDLREKRGAGGHKSFQNPNATRRKDPPHEGSHQGPHHGAHKGVAEGGHGRTPPAVAVAVASAESQLHGDAARRAEGTTATDNDGDPTFADLMGLVRQHLYVPDGKPPTNWDEARDGSILKQLLKHRRADDVAVAIEGLALLRDHPGMFGDVVDWLHRGAKATLKTLYNTRSGVLSTYELARQAYWKHANSRRDRQGTGSPTVIGDLVPKTFLGREAER